MKLDDWLAQRSQSCPERTALVADGTEVTYSELEAEATWVARRLAAHAKAHTSEVGPFVARTATEVHGGMGFTDLVGLHYWFKRIGFNRQILGGPERAREDAARAQGWIGN